MLTLRDLFDLFERYVPVTSRHASAKRGDGPLWWPAHEIGHLLTVPSSAIGRPLFGLDDVNDPARANVHERLCRELAAMSVSRKLLTACGRADLADQEVEDTDSDTMYYDPGKRLRVILREHRCLRLPRTRKGLETKLRRVLSNASKEP